MVARRRKDRRKPLLAAVLLSLSALVLGIVLLLGSPPSYTTTVYTVHDPGPPTSQWMILEDNESAPTSVSANNTGTIPEADSLSALNLTTIGTVCTSTAGPGSDEGACLGFETLAQTGWYWDSEYSLLYIHYEGGPSVTLSISMPTVVTTTVTTTSESNSTTTQTLTTHSTTRVTTITIPVKVTSTYVTTSARTTSNSSSFSAFIGPMIELVLAMAFLSVLNSLIGKKTKGKGH